MAAMRPTPGRSAASPTARSTCASPTEQRGELLELSERQQAIAGMKELWLSKTRVLPSRRVWPLWLPRPDLGPPAAKVRDGSRAAEAPLAERTSGFGSNIKHRERRGWAPSCHSSSLKQGSAQGHSRRFEDTASSSA